MKTSPTQRSLKLLRDRGYVAEVVEKWNPHARIRQDLFGCVDIVALSSTILAVQTTTSANMAARRDKILAEPKMRAWVCAGGAIHVHGWAKKGPRGEVKRWVVREQVIELTDFPVLEMGVSQ